MANEKRLRTGFVGGLVEDNPLAVGGTTLTSAGLAWAPVVDSTNHLALIFDPDGIGGAPEVAYVTAHSAGAVSATIARAQEGSTARQHDRDTPWVHAPTLRDYPKVRRTVLDGIGTITVSSTTRTPIDSTNLAFVYLDLEIGDIVECTFEAMVNTTGGGSGFVDFEVDQPSSANTYIANNNDSGIGKWTAANLLMCFVGTFRATERGSHGFRPVAFRSGGTSIQFENAASGSADTLITFLVRYWGAEASS